MYDMYPWNDRPGPATSDRRDDRHDGQPGDGQPGDGQQDRRGARLPAPRDGRNPLTADASRPQAASRPAAETPTAPVAETGTAAEAMQAMRAMQAVQVALDRRDNGGDAVGAVSPATSDRTRQ